MRRLLGALVPVGMLLIASCGSSESSSTTPVPTSAVTTTVAPPDSTTPDTTVPGTPVTTGPDRTLPAPPVEAIAYFADESGQLVALRREIGWWDGRELMDELLAGPTSAEAARGVHSAIPSGTEVISVTVAGSEVLVNLTNAFTSGGGSESMLMRAAQVVFTLTQLPDVDAVRFRIDGQPVTSIGGEGVMVDGVGRADFDALLPEIFVESPLEGDEWANPMVLSGTASTFEATVNFQVVAPDGTVLQEGVTTASCGTGCVGVFAVELDPLPSDAARQVTIRVFDISEADGSEIDLVELHIG